MRGADNDEVATLTNNLAVLLAEDGRPEEAEGLLSHALPALKAALGPDHPTTRACAANLAHIGQAG